MLTRGIYTDGSFARRMMLYARPYICPFEELVKRTPEGSFVLDVGCGDGLFLNVLAELKRIAGGLGFDTSEVALQSARAAETESQTIEFRRWSAGDDWPDGEYDVVSMIDVLHHIPPADRRFALQEAARHAKPGGLFLFKDIGARPRWRAFFNSLHDFVLTGERVSYTPLDTVSEWVCESGMVEVERQVYNRFWYGHELLCFRKPT